VVLRGRERSVAWVDLNAIRHNVALLAAELPGQCRLCAVLKADGYGHGAVAVGRAAMEAGASWLGVSTVPEAQQLRDAGIDLPVLVFGPMTGAELYCAVAADAQVVVWSRAFAEAARRAGASVHVKLDSGMGRLGVAEDAALELAAIAAAGPSHLVGLMSHFATADEEEQTFFLTQLERFTTCAAAMRRRHPEVLCHIANSAATLREPRSHGDMVRCGIAVYGLDPANRDPDTFGLRPAMRWSSYLAGDRVVQPGESVGYGRRFIAERPTRIGIVPIGYGDGLCRALSNRGDVLIAGHRCRITGTMSMDQMTVQLPERGCHLGDEVVLIGESGGERILCEDIARLLDTINYEVVSDVSPRTVRRYVGEPWEGPA
jgi:alanine racemase